MILYFSGTGNSFAIAKWWAKKTGDRITAISNCWKNKTFYIDTDTLFLTYPVYYYDLPNIVSNEFFFGEKMCGCAKLRRYDRTCGGKN